MTDPDHRTNPPRETRRDAAADDVPSLLARWRDGDSGAQDALVALVYDELRALAGRYMARERADHTLQATALVHEALLRLLRQPASYNDRAHFFRAAAQAMRRILVDHARRVRAGTRIPRHEQVPIESAVEPALMPRVDLLALDDALGRLGQLDPSLVQIVELRCFVGLTIPEVAKLMEVSESTVSREWRMAKAWLRQALGEP